MARFSMNFCHTGKLEMHLLLSKILKNWLVMRYRSGMKAVFNWYASAGNCSLVLTYCRVDIEPSLP